MPGELIFTADWERLEEGSPEERACFAAIGIRYNDLWLTEGRDSYVNRVRPAPMLSGYHLAEWMAWNWWRLRWEPRSSAADWAFAHRMTAIGEGYVWPNISISSDGERIALITRQTPERPSTPFRYISDFAAVVSARAFESAVDQFVEQIRGQLRAEGVAETNLDSVWNDVREERSSDELAKRRKLEALLGRDPDEADEATVERLIADAATLGGRPVEELAADHGHGGELLSGDALRRIAQSSGFSASPRDAARLAPGRDLARPCDVPAWRLGADAARALREQEHLGGEPISNDVLVRLAGVESRSLTERRAGPKISFALDENAAAGKVVLRSNWETGRRFELARLLGDRIVAQRSGKLFLATRAYTYRQKMQRSFAAELLSPFQALDEMLARDYSVENQQDAASHFRVSDLTIRTLLVNHHRIERQELDEEFEAGAA